MNLSIRRRVVFVLGMFVALMLVGTGGYMLLEGWALHEAFFMTAITISTVGYSEVRPLSPRGEVFSVILILLGVGSVAYTFSVVMDYLIAGELRGALRRQRMQRTINNMNKHYIICGYGRVGEHVVDGLRANKFDIVVIDADPRHADTLEEKGVAYITGDATDDSVLSEAGIERADGLCACLPEDATNVFTVLSARTLNPSILIIARCNAPETERKLRLAGANQIINPYMITGHRMAAQLLHPGIEEIIIASDSEMSGQTLGEAHVRGETGVNVLAVRRADGLLDTALTAEYRLHAGDALIGLGTIAQLTALAEKAKVRSRKPHVATVEQR
jgi:voltage-gated potassium channel